MKNNTKFGADFQSDRWNFVTFSDLIERNASASVNKKPIGQIKSLIGGFHSNEYEICENSHISIDLKIETNGMYYSYCFSMFIMRSENSPIFILARIGSGDYSTSKQIVFDKKKDKNDWERFSVFYHFPSKPREISVHLKFETPNQFPSRLGIGYFSLENGVYPINPIPTQGQSQFQPALHKCFHAPPPFDTFPDCGHILITYCPDWYPEQVKIDCVPTVLHAVNQENSTIFKLFHDPYNRGRLKLNFGGCVFFSHMDFIQNDIISVSFDWNANGIFVYQEGLLAIKSAYVLGGQTCKAIGLGHSVLPQGESIGGTVHETLVTSCSFDQRDIRQILYGRDEHRFAHFESEVSNRILRYTALHSQQLALFEEIIRYVFKWVLSTPENTKLKLESDYQMDLTHKFRMIEELASMEEITTSGRTDILIQKKIGREIHKLRLELKIYPRNDYKNVPSKPLKYMGQDEAMSIYVMIVPGSYNCLKEIQTEFYNSPQGNKSFPLIHKSEVNPFGPIFPFHFISTHEDLGQGRDKSVLCILAPQANNKSAS